MCLLTSGVGKLINGSAEKQTVSSGQKPTLKKRVLIREWAPTGIMVDNWTVSLLFHKAYLRLSTM